MIIIGQKKYKTDILGKFLTSLALLLLAVISVIRVNSEKTNPESDLYDRDYNLCIKDLPRNKDCVAVKIIFKEVNNEK